MSALRVAQRLHGFTFDEKRRALAALGVRVVASGKDWYLTGEIRPSADVVPTRLFKEAIRQNCPAIIVAHNHPSGDPTPSPEDVAVTAELVKAGKLLDVSVLDHLIIGGRGHVSLRRRGLGFNGA